MAADPKKVIDLRSLQSAIAGKVELAQGVFDVRKLDVGQYQTAMAIDHQGDPRAALEASVQLVVEIMPDLPETQVRKLPPEVLSAVIALATQGVEAVEELFPNAASPETSSTSPG